MITTVELIKKVRCLINEADDDAELSLITDDMRSIDDTISGLLPQAVAIVQKQCNGCYVNAKALNAALQESGDGFMCVALPQDFEGMVSARLTSWRVSCKDIFSSDSPDALYKFGKNAGGLSTRPLCVLDFSGDGERVVKFFPSSSADSLAHFVYEARFNATDGLNMCDNRMADAVAYVCAALLYNVFERYDAAKSFMSFATALCGGNVQ